MKRIVSVSLGSSKRNHSATIDILGNQYTIERVGTDGNLKAVIALIKELDGKVDAFGMGGIDLYLWGGNKRYMIREAIKIKNAARITPIVDGSGLKNTLERKVIYQLAQDKKIQFRSKKVLLPSAMDRFGMAEAIADCGGDLIVGDFIFALGVNLPIYSLKRLHQIARVVAPVVCQLPFKLLYPTGSRQEQGEKHPVASYYDQAQIIAGDFHYIKRFMPPNLKDKIIITNTVTEEDVEELRNREAFMLVTTTPEVGGRSFGTNVMEALLVALAADRGLTHNTDQYEVLLKEINLQPRIEYLNPIDENSIE